MSDEKAQKWQEAGKPRGHPPVASMKLLAEYVELSALIRRSMNRRRNGEDEQPTRTGDDRIKHLIELPLTKREYERIIDILYDDGLDG